MFERDFETLPEPSLPTDLEEAAERARPRQEPWQHPDVQTVEGWIDDENKMVWIKRANTEPFLARPISVGHDFQSVLVRFDNPKKPG